MTDLESWAKARGMDLAAHLDALNTEAVRERTMVLEKAHQKWIKQIDKEIRKKDELAAAAGLDP